MYFFVKNDTLFYQAQEIDYEIKKIMQQSSDSGTFLFCIVPDTGTGC
jgi:hypothetical protein